MIRVGFLSSFQPQTCDKCWFLYSAIQRILLVETLVLAAWINSFRVGTPFEQTFSYIFIYISIYNTTLFQTGYLKTTSKSPTGYITKSDILRTIYYTLYYIQKIHTKILKFNTKSNLYMPSADDIVRFIICLWFSLGLLASFALFFNKFLVPFMPKF